MLQPIVLVDAFTGVPFAGNPAAVCVLQSKAPAAWMQSVALEMNQAETAFLVKRPEGAGAEYDLRWFTPGSEVDLCGHATLASAHHLYEAGLLAPDTTARFHTRSGVLTARRLLLDGEPWIELDFPAEPVTPVPVPEELQAMLGATPIFFGRNRMDFLAELKDEAAVWSLRPDLRAINRMSEAAHARGMIVTAQGTDADIVSRCFYPAIRIDEDPVTGSAHCALAPYWMGRLGKQELLAFQASARGGWLRLRLKGDRVLLRGQAVTTLQGALRRGPE